MGGARERTKKGTWGVSPGQVRGKLGMGTLLSLAEGAQARSGFLRMAVGLAWACLITTETSCATAEWWEVARGPHMLFREGLPHGRWGDTGGPGWEGLPGLSEGVLGQVLRGRPRRGWKFAAAPQSGPSSRQEPYCAASWLDPFAKHT